MSARARAGLWRDGTLALARATYAGPPSPRRAWQAARTVARLGPTPATLVGLGAVRFPDQVALVDDDGPLSYRELHDEASLLARTLHPRVRDAAGPLAILCRNGRGFVLALLAGAQLGRELVFLNTEFTRPQLAAVLERHRPAVLVHDPEYDEAVAATGFTGVVVRADGVAGALGRPGPALPRVRTAVRMTILTSGTTGLAKGVSRSISRRALAELGISTMAITRFSRRDVVLAAPPFFHAFGLLTLLGTLGVGGTVVCHARFDAATTLADLDRYDATVLAGVPVMFQRLIRAHREQPGHDTSSLRLAITGGAKIGADVVRAFIDAFGPTLVNGYGSTEVGLVTLADGADLAEDPRTLGRPTLGVDVRILREDRTRADGSEIGTIFVRGGMGFGGYVADRRGERAKEVVDGYVSTGDRGFLDGRGRLRILDREDDMIVSGGENIFPTEVEAAIGSHPLVAESVVVGVPDEEYGQVLHAYVVLHDPTAELTPATLKAHLADRLERYKQPKRFVVVPELPRNATGKVLRSALPDVPTPAQEGQPS